MASKIILFAAAGGIVLATGASALPLNPLRGDNKPIPSGRAPIPIQEEYEYVYLGCMHSTHECHDQAEASGFQHWTVRHGYGKCHHPPHDHACWGYND